MNKKLNEIEWTKQQLWEGCILASIAHAIMVAHYPDLSNEHSWDGINYNVQGEGVRGTVTFHPEYLIAAIRDENSEHFIWGSDIENYFKDAPKRVVELANDETLQYLLDNVGGGVTPVISTAFWQDGNQLFAKDSNEDMIKNGGFLLKNQVVDSDLAIEAWKEYFDMNPIQIELLKEIYNKKVANPEGELILTKAQIEMIGSDDEAGLEESKVSFEEMGIGWEA